MKFKISKETFKNNKNVILHSLLAVVFLLTIIVFVAFAIANIFNEKAYVLKAVDAAKNGQTPLVYPSNLFTNLYHFKVINVVFYFIPLAIVAVGFFALEVFKLKKCAKFEIFSKVIAIITTLIFIVVLIIFAIQGSKIVQLSSVNATLEVINEIPHTIWNATIYVVDSFVIAALSVVAYFIGRKYQKQQKELVKETEVK